MNQSHEITSFPAPFGKYALLRALGRGKNSHTYLAKAPGGGSGGFYVLKTPRIELIDSPQGLQTFIFECELTCRMEHTNVVRGLEWDWLDRSPFLVTEFVDRATPLQLAMKRIRKNPFTPQLSLQVIKQLLDAVTYLHNLADQNGRPMHLIHRDIGLHNIMMFPNGRIKLIDLGSAVTCEHPEDGYVISETRDNNLNPRGRETVIRSWHAWQAPELRMRGYGNVDQRADLYSVGAVLLTLLTGRLLFGRKDPNPVVKIWRPDDLSVLPSHEQVLALSLSVAEKAIQLEPTQRYQSAFEFTDAVNDVLGAIESIPS